MRAIRRSAPDLSEWPPSPRPQAGSYGVRGGANHFRAEGWNVSNRLAPSSPKNHSIVGARLRAIRRSASPIHQNGHPRFARKRAPTGCAAARITSVRKAGMSRIRLAPSSPKRHPTVGARLRAIRRSAPDLSEWPPSPRPQAGSYGVRGGANHYRAKGWNISISAHALTPKTPLDCRSPLAGDG